MTSWVVVDSGIVIASVLPEPLSGKAETLLKHYEQNAFQLAAPTLFLYEIVAVMRKSVFRNIITDAEAQTRLNLLLAQPIQLMIDNQLLRRAYDIATQFNRPTAYDAQYLAVAERLGCEFWTANERLYNSVSTTLNWVKWLNNFTG